MLPFAQHGPLKWSFFLVIFFCLRINQKWSAELNKLVDYYDQQITFHAIFQCHEVLDNHFFPKCWFLSTYPSSIEGNLGHRGGQRPQTHCLKRILPKMFQRESLAPKRSVSIKTDRFIFIFFFHRIQISFVLHLKTEFLPTRPQFTETPSSSQFCCFFFFLPPLGQFNLPGVYFPSVISTHSLGRVDVAQLHQSLEERGRAFLRHLAAFPSKQKHWGPSGEQREQTTTTGVCCAS